jgi:hypothetical protein
VQLLAVLGFASGRRQSLRENVEELSCGAKAPFQPFCNDSAD